MYIGIDIVEIARLAAPSQVLLNKLFTPYEQDYIRKKNNPATTAGLFAAKEAVSKALSTGLTFPPTHIEIRHTQGGKPYPVLHHQARAILKGMVVVPVTGMRQKVFDVSLSISHTDAIATAVCVISSHK